MTAFRVLCVTASIILFEIISGAQIGNPLDGKSAISTEYRAKFHKLHRNGINSSEGYIAGVHNMEKNTDEESWPSFASKCADVIKGIVSALTGAVSSEPGERTDLQLDFKNRIYHHDNRRVNGSDCCKLPEADEYGDGDLEEDIALTEFPTEYPGVGNIADDTNIYQYGKQRPIEPFPTGGLDGLGYGRDEVTQASPEPTWNTPATQEIAYRPTEQITQIPYYQGDKTVVTEFPGGLMEKGGVTTPPSLSLPSSDYHNTEVPEDAGLDDESSDPYQTSFGEDLPLDNWKPIHDGQDDFLPETPAGFGEGQTPSGLLYTVPPETYTTPSPVSETELPKALVPELDDSFGEGQSKSVSTLQSANQISNPAEPAYEDECTKDDDDDDDDDDDSDDDDVDVDDDGDVSSEEKSFIPDSYIPEEETATTYPDYYVAEATQNTPVEGDKIVPPEGSQFNPQQQFSDETVAEVKKPVTRPPIYSFLTPTTPSPPPDAIYIPITNSQTESMTEGPNDTDDDCCCDEDTYDDESPTHKVICKNACRDLEQARNELKEIFDKIKKKLRCSRRLSY